jgi:hypothetical protein
MMEDLKEILRVLDSTYFRLVFSGGLLCWVLLKAGNVLASLATLSFLRTVLCGLSYKWLHVSYIVAIFHK